MLVLWDLAYLPLGNLILGNNSIYFAIKSSCETLFILSRCLIRSTFSVSLNSLLIKPLLCNFLISKDLLINLGCSPAKTH